MQRQALRAARCRLSIVAAQERAVSEVAEQRGDAVDVPNLPQERQTCLVMRSGRYLIAGRMHSHAGEDPLAALRRRDPMVPLTDASIMFRVRADIVEEPAGTIVVNRDLVEWVREGELDARSFDLPA